MYAVANLPIVVWLMRDFFEALPIEVEEAALVDNVPSWRIFFGIVLPMPDWEAMAARLKAHGVEFVIEPYIRFKGEPNPGSPQRYGREGGWRPGLAAMVCAMNSCSLMGFFRLMQNTGTPIQSASEAVVWAP